MSNVVKVWTCKNNDGYAVQLVCEKRNDLG